MDSIVTEIKYFDKIISIEYLKKPLEYHEAIKPCGDGTYIYNSETRKLYRWSLSLTHELPYSYCDDWNSSKKWHLVTSSSIPLPVWWCDNDNDNLQFNDINCALTQIIKK